MRLLVLSLVMFVTQACSPGSSSIKIILPDDHYGIFSLTPSKNGNVHKKNNGQDVYVIDRFDENFNVNFRDLTPFDVFNNLEVRLSSGKKLTAWPSNSSTNNFFVAGVDHKGVIYFAYCDHGEYLKLTKESLEMRPVPANVKLLNWKKEAPEHKQH